MSDYYKLFGVPEPGEGENEQEPADPAAETGPAGENEQEPADPADTEPMEEPEDEEPSSEGTDGKPEQSTEERRKQAAKRRADAESQRQKEEQERIANAVNDAISKERAAQEEKLKAFLQAADLKNPKTGKPVSTVEEMEQWQQDFDAARLERELKAGRLTPAGLQQALATMPQVKELIDGAQTARQNANSAEFQAKTAMEIAEIQKMNPEIKSIGDILKMDTGREFAAAVKKGNSFVDAYRLANFSAIVQQQRSAARQAAMNDTAGKKHMQASGQQAKGAVSVTATDRERFRRFNPGMTDEEIARYL